MRVGANLNIGSANNALSIRFEEPKHNGSLSVAGGKHKDLGLRA
jgi:hypothetical protein